VHDSNGDPLAGVQLFTYAALGGLTYLTSTSTDANGNYSMTVINGNWTVQINCCGCSDCSGGGCLSTTYQCPDTQAVTIVDNNKTNANLTVSFTGQPVLSQATLVAPGQVSFLLHGVIGSTYTIVTSSNLTLPMSSWITAYVTNLTVNPALILDPHATNKQLFYRARLGP